jgi:hypothetical protein
VPPPDSFIDIIMEDLIVPKDGTTKREEIKEKDIKWRK